MTTYYHTTTPPSTLIAAQTNVNNALGALDAVIYKHNEAWCQLANAGESLPLGGGTWVTLDWAQQYDSWVMRTSATEITIPYTGLYTVSLSSVRVDNIPNNKLRVEFQINGVRNHLDSGNDYSSFTYSRRFAANDVLTVRMRNDDSTDRTLNSGTILVVSMDKAT